MEPQLPQDRNQMLADVAEMYYLQQLTQAAIAERIGLTRSMISRLLDEARRKGIIEFRVHRPLNFDKQLSDRIQQRFGLHAAHVVQLTDTDPARVLSQVGSGAAAVLRSLVHADMVIGMAWGTFIRATLDSFEVDRPLPNVRVVQLVGAGDSRIRDYDGHALVSRMAQLTGGEAFYLNAPIMVDDASAAESVLESKAIRETIELARGSDLALLGMGSTVPEHSTFYHSGYFSLKDLDKLRRGGAIGNVCGMHFTLEGQLTSLDFQSRLVTISADDLLAIKLRVGVAGGPGKVEPILGALRGGFVNVLVTDNYAATQLLELAAQSSSE